MYYFIQMHPAGSGFPIWWRDTRCKTVFFLLDPADNITEMIRRQPEFLHTYSAPRLLEETTNSKVYVATRS